MADMNFACPACAQHITCDEAWAGHPIQCPICQANITVPAKVVARATGGKAESPLVPQPPAATRLSTKQPAQQPAQTGNRQIPIRDLTPPKPKQSNKLVTALATLGIVVALGAGAYFGWPYLKEWQAKMNEKSRQEAANSDGGQVGHIQDLNQTLNATEPSGAGLANLSQPPEGTAPAPSPDGSAPPAPMAATNLPVIPPVHTLEVAKAKIPEARVNGKISGTNFVADMVRLDPSGATQVLRFLQGAPASPDCEILVYLRLKPGEKVGGQKLSISSDVRAGAPSVVKRWKPNPRYAPQMKTFAGGYALQLELGQPAEGVIPGKVYIALPDPEKTVIAGVFRAGTSLTDAGTVDPSLMMNQAAPTQPTQPTVDPAQADAFRRRYGIQPRQ